jgi:catechol 2,3-dioxygenase-like lactoylglutathione lyase family enzyme
MSDLLGPDFITLLVRDLDASYHFYVELIGLRESPEKPPNAFAFATHQAVEYESVYLWRCGDRHRHGRARWHLQGRPS